MPVDQATYRPYEGLRRPRRGVALAIAGTMIRKLRRGLLLRIFVFGVPLLTSLIAVVAFAFYYENEMKLPAFAGINVLQAFNRSMLDSRGLSFLALMITALVGAPMIAEDRRAKALPLYFSRPVTHVQYVVGKMLALFFFLGLMLLGPAVLMFIAEVALNPKEGQFPTQLATFGNSLIPSLARIVSLSAVILGVSSLTRRSNHAALLFFGIVLSAMAAAEIFARTIFHDPVWLSISPRGCINRITMEHLPARFEPQTFTAGLSIGAAWTGISLWTVAGLTVLVLRIRKVEVVS